MGSQSTIKKEVLLLGPSSLLHLFMKGLEKRIFQNS